MNEPLAEQTDVGVTVEPVPQIQDHRRFSPTASPSLDTFGPPKPVTEQTQIDGGDVESGALSEKHAIETELLNQIRDATSSYSSNEQASKKVIKQSLIDFATTQKKSIQEFVYSLPEDQRAIVDNIAAEVIQERVSAQLQLQVQMDAALNDNREQPAVISKETTITNAAITQDQEGGNITGEEAESNIPFLHRIRNNWNEVLPYLLALDTSFSLLSGNSPQLAMVLRQVDELGNGKETNEALLLRMEVPLNIIETFQRERITDKFFEYFRDKKADLIAFFNQITPSSGNMFLFLEKVPPTDLRIMVEKKKLPGEIYLTEEELNMLLSKLTVYERSQLNIHASEPRMRY